MAEELLGTVLTLCIDEEEDQIYDLDALMLLLPRLLTEHSYNVEAFKRTITIVWAPIHPGH